MTTTRTLMVTLTVCLSISMMGCPQKRGTIVGDGKEKIEFENLKYTKKSSVIEVTVDDTKTNDWSGGKGVILTSTKNNEYVIYDIPVEDDTPRNVAFQGIKNREYGRYRVGINNLPTGKVIDFYGISPAKTELIDLGNFKPKDGKLSIAFALVGRNSRSTGAKYGAGFDYMIITKAKQ